MQVKVSGFRAMQGSSFSAAWGAPPPSVPAVPTPAPVMKRPSSRKSKGQGLGAVILEMLEVEKTLKKVVTEAGLQ